MFKKIISAIFAAILIVFSAATLVSCTTTEIATGLQRLFYKNAKIASFAAASAILNDKDEAEATSSDSVLKGGTIGQEYLMNKYGQMTVDSALGKDFIINQNGETKMSELFESTFKKIEGKTNYIYTNSDNQSGNRIVADDTTGKTAGTNALDKITSQIEPLLDMLTIGISPSTLSTLVSVFFQEKVDLGHEIGNIIGNPDLKISFSSVMAEIENPDSMIHEIMNDYILDYQTESKETVEKTMADLETKIKDEKDTKTKVALSVQFIKLTLKTSYNFFDEYLENKINDYQTYVEKTFWTEGIADNIIDFSKLTNLFKYAATTDKNLKLSRSIAQEAMSPMMTHLPLVLGTGIQEILKIPGVPDILPNWKENGGVTLLTAVFNLLNKLMLYVETKDDAVLDAMFKHKGEVFNLVNEVLDLLYGLSDEVYEESVGPLLTKLIKSIDVPPNLQSIIDKVAGYVGKREGMLSIKNLIKLSFTWNLIAPSIKNLVKPLLANVTTDDVFSFKPLSLMNEMNFLSEVGNDNTMNVLLGAFQNLSIENITKFLADRLEPMSKDTNITFNLNSVSELINRVKTTRVRNGDIIQKLSEFTHCEDPYEDKCPMEWKSSEIKFIEVDKDEKEVKELFKYDKTNAPVEHQQFYMALGLDQMGANVAEGSIGDTIVKLFGKDSGELLYSLSTIIQDILIKIPGDSEIYLDNKYLKPLYQRSNWTMDDFGKFKKSLPVNVDKKNPVFSFNLYRDLPSGSNKTYKVTMRQDDDKYWEITNITK